MLPLKVAILLLVVTPVLSQDCSGTRTIDAVQGSIRDHIGPDGSLYGNDLDCLWLISVPGEYVSWNFTYFDTEDTYDHVLIYSSHDTSEEPVLSLSGNKVDRHYSSPSNQIAVRFTSDTYVRSTGFELNFFSSSCPTRCSGNGLCVDTTCQCDAGLTGAACEVGIGGCTEGCNQENGGECDGGVCHCPPGWHGDVCDDPYCVPETVLTAPSGVIVDHAHEEGGRYRQNAQCSWTIVALEESTIALDFSQFALSSAGRVEVYDGNDTDVSHMVGYFSGASSVPPVTYAHSGFMRIVFSGASPHRGFSANYDTFSCGSGCGDHGVCMRGGCHCEVGYGGPSCADRVCANDCHANATGSVCLANNTCSCAPGYGGIDCGHCEDHEATNTTCEACSGSVTIDGYGKLSDGFGEYSQGQLCSWIINGDTAVRVSFETFELLTGAYVRLYEGATLVGEFTGVAPPPPQTSRGPNLRVEFSTTASALVGEGFTATATSLSCPDNCSGNGRCTADGSCQCELGFGGASCAVTVCVDDCGAADGKGECSGARCVCAPGYFGPDCQTEFCYGLTTIVGESGTIVDHAGGGRYLPRSNCEWRVDTPAPINNITLVFNALQLEDGYDFLRVATHDRFDDGRFADGNYLGFTTGSYPPVPLVVEAPAFSLLFTSDEIIEMRGFSVSWYANSICPEQCSGHGNCIAGDCTCTGGYAGENCAIRPALIPLEEVYIPYTVSRHEWIYFSFVQEAGKRTTVQVRREVTDREVLVFSRFGDYPEFPGAYDRSGTFDSATVDRILLGSQAGLHYIGVYGYEGGAFEIRAIDTTPDPCDGVGVCPPPPSQCRLAGTCSNEAGGVCVYPVAPDGTACDDEEPWTIDDACSSGVCRGTNRCDTVTCERLDECHMVGGCDPMTGECSHPPVPDGIPCTDDGTRSECIDGRCGGAQYCRDYTCAIGRLDPERDDILCIASRCTDEECCTRSGSSGRGEGQSSAAGFASCEDNCVEGACVDGACHCNAGFKGSQCDVCDPDVRDCDSDAPQYALIVFALVGCTSAVLGIAMYIRSLRVSHRQSLQAEMTAIAAAHRAEEAAPFSRDGAGDGNDNDNEGDAAGGNDDDGSSANEEDSAVLPTYADIQTKGGPSSEASTATQAAPQPKQRGDRYNRL